MNSGYRTGPDGGVTDSRHSGNVVDVGIVIGKSFFQHSLESTFSIAVIIPVQIICPHLVNHNSHDELGSWHTVSILCMKLVPHEKDKRN